jgi:hypothetical protein
VVYGRNRKIHSSLCALLRALGLELLEWSALVDATDQASPYVSDVLRRGFQLAQTVVVLFTPDDEARLSRELQAPHDPEFERELCRQPRPNVLYEAGLADALFPGRAIFVEVGRLRHISDLSGRHFVRMDGSVEAREDLARRLRKAGCKVRQDDTAWRTAGDFSL